MLHDGNCAFIKIVSRSLQTPSQALTARAEGAHRERKVPGVGAPTPGTFLSRTARMRAVRDEKTTFEKP